jgi:hypothetical protein
VVSRSQLPKCLWPLPPTGRPPPAAATFPRRLVRLAGAASFTPDSLHRTPAPAVPAAVWATNPRPPERCTWLIMRLSCLCLSLRSRKYHGGRT